MVTNKHYHIPEKNLFFCMDHCIVRRSDVFQMIMLFQILPKLYMLYIYVGKGLGEYVESG